MHRTTQHNTLFIRFGSSCSLQFPQSNNLFIFVTNSSIVTIFLHWAVRIQNNGTHFKQHHNDVSWLVLINIKEIVSSSDSTPSNSLCLHCLFEQEKNARFCIRVQNSTYRILNGETFYNTVSFFGWLYSNVRCAMWSKWIFYRIIICDERAREINGPKQWICSPFIVKMKNENRNMKMISLCCFDCFVHSIILHIFYTTQFSAETIYLLLKKTLSILYIENRLNENALFSSQ